MRVRELAENKGLTVDVFINKLMRPASEAIKDMWGRVELPLEL